MTHKWKYWDEFSSENNFGFVYKITNTTTNKFYVGKKVFWNNKKHKLTKKQIAEQTGPGRKPTHETIRTESDWKTYWGSNKQLLADIKELGEDKFQCEILTLCKTKKQLTYYEMHYQCKFDCLTANSYNDNMLGKFFRKDLVS